MKAQLFAAIAVCIFLTSALFINPANSASAITATIWTSGFIENNQNNKQEFLIRYLWIGSLTTAEDVNAYVKAHPWGTGILLTDHSSSILSIISYTGWNATKTWRGTDGGVTYEELKIVIDEFHRLGWKVIYSPGNTPTKADNYLYRYLTIEHPELIAVAGNGFRYDQIYSNNIMVNFFANYTTPDLSRNISSGENLSELYVQRLTQMITDGSFEWDGWFGIDGWNGFTNQGMYWVWNTNQPFGRWVGTNDLSKWFYGDNQSIFDWTQSTYCRNLPTKWNSYNNTQKIECIINNYNLEWWQYWQDRFAKLYAKINYIFNSRPPEMSVGTIIAQDLSSTWAENGINNPTGMENLTMFAKYDSFNHYYIDSEWWGDLDMAGRYSAYVAGLVKSKIPSAHCISQMPIAYADTTPMPTWVWKQMYLAMIQTYVWCNGIQYRAVDQDWMLVWGPVAETWNDTIYHGQEMADWVTKIANTMNKQITPIWIGPVEIQPLYFSGIGTGGTSLNFTFAQYIDTLNINSSNINIVSEMGTLFLDAIGSYGNAIGGNAYDRISELFSNGHLNIIFHGHGSGVSFNTIFMGKNDFDAYDLFKLTPRAGTSYEMRTPPIEQVTNENARYIIGKSFNQTYLAQYYGTVEATTGTTPLITYSDGCLALGISSNTSTGKFLYGKELSGNGYSPAIIVPRDVINRGIYWASECPINISDSLADLKIFKSANGDILITIMNLRDFYSNMTLHIDLTGIGLDKTRTYKANFIGTESESIITDLSAVKVILLDGADILKISTL